MTSKTAPASASARPRVVWSLTTEAGPEPVDGASGAACVTPAVADRGPCSLTAAGTLGTAAGGAVSTTLLAGGALLSTADGIGDSLETIDGETIDGETIDGETIEGEMISGETIDG